MMAKEKPSVLNGQAKSKTTKPDNAVINMDVTCFLPSVEELNEFVKNWKKWLRENTRNWGFQIEEAPTTKKLHLQGRFKLKEKMRISTLSGQLPYASHLSQTSRANQNNMFYVQKVESRYLGPWTDKDVYIPRQLRELTSLRPWQESVVNLSKTFDPRTVNVIVDKTGGAGKSTLAMYIQMQGLGIRIPPLTEYKNVVQTAKGFIDLFMESKDPEEMENPLMIVMDIPRSVPMKEIQNVFGAIETIKDGWLFETRFHASQRYIDSPNLWVFMNYDPPLAALSLDRWRYWHIVGNELLPRP